MRTPGYGIRFGCREESGRFFSMAAARLKNASVAWSVCIGGTPATSAASATLSLSLPLSVSTPPSARDRRGLIRLEPPSPVENRRRTRRTVGTRIIKLTVPRVCMAAAPSRFLGLCSLRKPRAHASHFLVRGIFRLVVGDSYRPRCLHMLRPAPLSNSRDR